MKAINQANGRLKAGRVGVVILQRGNRLHLRATLPPKPHQPHKPPHQQIITLGIYANPPGIAWAEKQARLLGGQLAGGIFHWEEWIAVDRPPETIGQWRSRFFEEFPKQRQLSQISWDTDYKRPLNRLPGEAPLTAEYLEDWILANSKPNSSPRKRLCQAFTRLATFAGLEVDFSHIKGRYSSRAVDPRTLPTDGAIVEVWHGMEQQDWAYVYALMATYGLRNHETFLLDLETMIHSGLAVVLSGKTGRRLVYPFYPEWVELFDLRSPRLPQGISRTRSHASLGNAVSKNLKIPFEPYNLRHCWAVRSLEFGLDISLAAQQMGHSVRVHSETYHHWITADVHERAYAALIANPHRPKWRI